MTINFIRAAIIYVLVIFAVRLMGKRTVGELKPHELVITILVSSVASIPLEDNSMPLSYSILPILLFASLEIIMASLSLKSLRFRNILQGRPIFVIRNGKLDEKKLKSMRFTVDDLVDALRQKDVFDISQVQDAIIETNGSMSVLLKSEEQPLTAKSADIRVEECGMPIVIVLDGKIVTEYFNQEKIPESEIKLILTKNDIDEGRTMLLTIDNSGNIVHIPKENQ
ncbi:MAG: DUF421 domain-containing protein [Eubacterium sp.]|nr:DUF421 domain-containing protein [Eubacterium sp.]